MHGDRGSIDPGEPAITVINDFGRGDLRFSGVIVPDRGDLGSVLDLQDFGDAIDRGEVGVGSRSWILVDQRVLMSSVSAIELRGSM